MVNTGSVMLLVRNTNRIPVAASKSLTLRSASG
jgi:hypothetical protein